MAETLWGRASSSKTKYSFVDQMTTSGHVRFYATTHNCTDVILTIQLQKDTWFLAHNLSKYSKCFHYQISKAFLNVNITKDFDLTLSM